VDWPYWLLPWNFGESKQSAHIAVMGHSGKDGSTVRLSSEIVTNNRVTAEAAANDRHGPSGCRQQVCVRNNLSVERGADCYSRHAIGFTLARSKIVIEIGGMPQPVQKSPISPPACTRLKESSRSNSGGWQTYKPKSMTWCDW
jgi:hypothetical protein